MFEEKGYKFSTVRKVAEAIVKMTAGVSALLLIAAAAIATQAATYTVNSTADPGVGVCDLSECTLREAISAANATSSDDVIEFDLSVFSGPSTITLTIGQLSIGAINSGKLTINGPGADILSVSGNDAYRVFQINEGFELEIHGLTITRGFEFFGAGIFSLYHSKLSLIDSTVSGNHSSGGAGAGICIFDSADTYILNSTIKDNSGVGGPGGGIYAENTVNAGKLYVANSTISGNSGSSGGGIRTENVDLDLRNSTLSGNSAVGANLYASPFSTTPGSVTIYNSILANGVSGPDCIFTEGSQGLLISYSLIEDGSCSVANGVNGNKTGDPLLGPLEDNGGPTLTHALLPGSPAIDSGSNSLAVDAVGSPLNTDQRGTGFLRIVNNTVDMGAFEFQNPDSDGDGVLDVDDICPGSVIPETGDFELKKNRFAVDVDGNFVDVDGTFSGYTIGDTGGCSATQIIEDGGYGLGHERFGITRSVLESWIAMLPPQ